MYSEMHCKSVEKKEAKRKYDQEKRKRKRIEESLLGDAQVGGEKREKRLKVSQEKLMKKLEEGEEIENQEIGEHQQCVESQEEEEVEEEEDQSDCLEKMEKAGAVLMSDVNNIPQYTSWTLRCSITWLKSSWDT